MARRAKDGKRTEIPVDWSEGYASGANMISKLGSSCAAGTAEKVVMIEAGANEVDDDTMLNAIIAGHTEIKKEKVTVPVWNSESETMGKATVMSYFI